MPSTSVPDATAHINGMPLHAPGETVAADVLRQRACTELLRQAAQRAGLLGADDAAAVDGATSEAATRAIETLIESEVAVPEPEDAACRRWFAAHRASFAVGERVDVRHILFAVTPGVDVAALRGRAESALLDVRCREREDSTDRFAAVARELSNCPSGAQGGQLGWLNESDCAPEFAREIFGRSEIGVLPRLVHSRFGLHVVEVMARESGTVPDYEAVRQAVHMRLRQQAFVTALRQYLRLLAGSAVIAGVDLEHADSPLVQ